MPKYPKHIVTDHTSPYTEIILEKLGYKRAEDSVEAPKFKIEHVIELISRGTIPIHVVRETDGTLYLPKEIAFILCQAYQDLAKAESHEDAEADGDESANSDIVSKLERNFNKLVDIQIDQLKTSIDAYNKQFGTEYERDEKTLIKCCLLLKDLAKMRELYGR